MAAPCHGLNYLRPTYLPAVTDTFRIVWETPSGQFGFATFEECDGLDDAVSFFHSEKAAGAFPADANLEQITPVVASR